MKKGFTLVELLAVIAILAILILIAVPNVIELFKEAKKNTFLTEVKKIYTGAEQEYIKDAFSSTSKTKTYSKCSSGCSNGLSMNTRKELEYYVEMHNGKIIKLFVKDSDYQYSYVGELDLNDIKEVEEIALTDEVITIGSTGADYVDQNIEAKFITGPELNVKMKKLAGDDTSSNGYNTINTSITAIKRFTGTPSASNMQSNNLVSVENSNKPIYMWYEDGTIYWYTEAQKPSLNRDSSYLLRYMVELADISSFSDFNTSHVRDMGRLFFGCSKITSLEPIRNWDTGRVTNMRVMFGGSSPYAMHITSLDPLINWNTSNVTDMCGLFQDNIGITNVDGLLNWDTSNVTTFLYLFNGDYTITNLNGLRNWNTGNVTDMQGAFHNVSHLTDASGIANWDVSKVENMSYMFNLSSDLGSYCFSELGYMDLSKWNMVNVKNYNWFLESYRWLKTEFTVRSTKVETYKGMLQDLANYGGGPVVVNYTAETEELVDKMLTTVSSGGNVVKGRLVE